MVDTTTRSERGLSIVTLIIGAWLIASPYILGYVTQHAIWQQVIGGVIIVAVAAWQLSAPRMRWPSWITAIVGAWLIIAPFATVYADGAAYLNQIVFGLIMVGLSIWQLDPGYVPARRHGGGGHGAHPAH